MPKDLMKPQEARVELLELLGDIVEDLTGDREGYYDWRATQAGVQNFDYWECDGFFGYGRDYNRTFAVDAAPGEGKEEYRRAVALLDGRDGWNVGWADQDSQTVGTQQTQETQQTQLVHDEIGGVLISWIPVRGTSTTEQILFQISSHCYPDDPVTGEPVVSGLNAE